MYTQTFEDFLNYLSKLNSKPKVLFLSCISFEPRCKKSSIIIDEYRDFIKIVWFFFEIIDNGSKYETECLEIQNNHKEELLEQLKLTLDVPKYKLFNKNVGPEESLISLAKEALKKNSDIDYFILDISAIPKKIYVPFLKWALENEKFNNVVICYTKPKEYTTEELELEQQRPETLIGYYKRDRDIIWIPSLGFKSEFTKSIWDFIKNINSPTRILKKEITPILGFPAYRPDFYDKSLINHIKTFEKNSEFLKGLQEKKISASADDPFQIYHLLKNILKNNDGKEIILTPLGPKPIAFGLTLFAINYNLPLVSVQAKTYHPEYSKGASETDCYWIIRNKKFTFNK